METPGPCPWPADPGYPPPKPDRGIWAQGQAMGAPSFYPEEKGRTFQKLLEASVGLMERKSQLMQAGHELGNVARTWGTLGPPGCADI